MGINQVLLLRVINLYLKKILNLKWVDICSACNLLDKEDPVNKWYKNLLNITNKPIT